MPLLLRKNIGLVTILFLCALPAALWVISAPISMRFSNLGAAAASLGQLSGLLGLVLFSINLILSLRSKSLDKYFYGLNKLYVSHHQIGAIAFILLLFHPLFLVFNYIRFSLRSAALFLLPSGNLAVTYGIIALGLMILSMVFTFYARLKYQNWKVSHKFMTAVFVFAFLHIIFISSDISRNMFLRYYVLSLAILGFIVGFYRAFLSKIFNRNFTYIIKEVIPLNGNMTIIRMAPLEKIMEYMPGQFVFVSFSGSKVSSEIHPFSITSNMTDKYLELVVKSLGDFTAELKNLQVGEKATIEGPFGRFSYQQMPNENQVWIAGGIGVTPFISMARSLNDEKYKVDLYYCVNNQSEAVLLDELIKLSEVNKNLKIIPWYSKDRGYVSGQAIAEMSQGLAGKDILLCGPGVFMKNLRKQFLTLGIGEERIHWELFNFL